MRKLFVFAIAFLLAVPYLKAQSSDPELEYIKKAYSKEKKTIVDEYMALDVQQGAKFWPIYAEYEATREKLAKERFLLIKEYVDSSANINDKLADKIALGLLNNSIKLDKLNLEYFIKIKKELGALKAAKFMQLEVYLQTTWRALIQDNIPVIGDLEKTKGQ